MDMYDTLYMLQAIEELPLEHTFMRDRYFTTDEATDIFNTSRVFADYRELDRKRAPFVMPRIGAVPVGRDGFQTFELEPAYIGVSMPLTLEQLKKRGFGESILSGLTPEDRARQMQLRDMDTLSSMISRTQEWMAGQTLIQNGCTMRHLSDREDVYDDVPVAFYEGDTDPNEYTVTSAWTHSEVNTKGVLTVGNWYNDICAMISQLKKKGRAATDLLVSSDVGAFLMEDQWILRMLDNRRAEMGRIAPSELTPDVTHIGAFNFRGRMLDILVDDGTYQDLDGTDKAFLDDGTCIVTAPDCGKCIYGAITQMEADGEFHTYAGKRVPQHYFTIQPPAKETRVASAPLMVPKRTHGWRVAKNVFATV